MSPKRRSSAASTEEESIAPTVLEPLTLSAQRDTIEKVLAEAVIGATLSYAIRYTDPTGGKPSTPWSHQSADVTALLYDVEPDTDIEPPVKWLKLSSGTYFPETSPNSIIEYASIKLENPFVPQVVSPKGLPRGTSPKRPKRPRDESQTLEAPEPKRARMQQQYPPQPHPTQPLQPTRSHKKKERLQPLPDPSSSDDDALRLANAYAQAAAATDRDGSTWELIVPGLRVPQYIKPEWAVWYPHLNVGNPIEHTKACIDKFALDVAVEWKSQVRKEEFEYMKDVYATLLVNDLAFTPQADGQVFVEHRQPQNRQEYALLYETSARLLALLSCAAVLGPRTNILMQLREAFEAGKIDLRKIWTTTKATRAEPDAPHAQTVVPQATAAPPPMPDNSVVLRRLNDIQKSVNRKPKFFYSRPRGGYRGGRW